MIKLRDGARPLEKGVDIDAVVKKAHEMGGYTAKIFPG